MSEATTINNKEFNKMRLFSNTLSLIVALITALGVGFGFYFNTKTTLESNAVDMREVKDAQKNIENQLHDIQVFKGVSSTELENLDEKVEHIEEDLQKMDTYHTDSAS